MVSQLRVDNSLLTLPNSAAKACIFSESPSRETHCPFSATFRTADLDSDSLDRCGGQFKVSSIIAITFLIPLSTFRRVSSSQRLKGYCFPINKSSYLNTTPVCITTAKKVLVKHKLQFSTVQETRPPIILITQVTIPDKSSINKYLLWLLFTLVLWSSVVLCDHDVYKGWILGYPKCSERPFNHLQEWLFFSPHKYFESASNHS